MGGGCCGSEKALWRRGLKEWLEFYLEVKKGGRK
jgi:hypothetical protein